METQILIPLVVGRLILFSGASGALMHREGLTFSLPYMTEISVVIRQ